MSVFSKSVLSAGFSAAALLTTFTPNAFALSPLAQSLADDPNAYVLTQNDVANGGFIQRSGIVVIDSALTSSDLLSVLADNIIVVGSGSIQSTGQLSLTANELAAVDGSLETEAQNILINAPVVELDGGIDGSVLTLAGADVSARGEWALESPDRFGPELIVIPSSTDGNMPLAIESSVDMSIRSSNNVTLSGFISSDNRIEFNGGSQRMELGQQFQLLGSPNVSTVSIGEFLLNTPLELGNLSFNSTNAIIVEDIAINFFSSSGIGNITIQDNTTVTVMGGMQLSNNGNVTILGGLDVAFPDPSIAGSIPFNIVPGDDLIIQNTGSITANVRMILAVGNTDSEGTDEIINFGNIFIELPNSDSLPVQGDVVTNFGDITVTAPVGETSTINFVGFEAANNFGTLNADVVNIFN